mmetsp:Transcript_100035/g.173621  ORF Transcript_100035/g.173621 Transcript_100035/m.173621 type:complete len:320 (-) Transcript_100035:739-1698(-)
MPSLNPAAIDVCESTLKFSRIPSALQRPVSSMRQKFKCSSARVEKVTIASRSCEVSSFTIKRAACFSVSNFLPCMLAETSRTRTMSKPRRFFAALDGSGSSEGCGSATPLSGPAGKGVAGLAKCVSGHLTVIMPSRSRRFEETRERSHLTFTCNASEIRSNSASGSGEGSRSSGKDGRGSAVESSAAEQSSIPSDAFAANNGCGVHAVDVDTTGNADIPSDAFAVDNGCDVHAVDVDTTGNADMSRRSLSELRISTNVGLLPGSPFQHVTIRSDRACGQSGGTASISGRAPCTASRPTHAGSSSSKGISRQMISNMSMA